MREIELTYQKNIRDLGGLVGYGGKKVKSGVLYRGGFLDKISFEDEVILNGLHFTDVIDFRSELEYKSRPDFRLEGVTYHNFPPLIDHLKDEDKHLADSNLLWFVSPDKTGFEHMVQMYEEMIYTEIGKKAYRDFFKLLLEKDGVFYFHCSQGKDRAGLAAFFLEIALGVDMTTARRDYLLSNKAMGVRIDHLLQIVKTRPYFNERYEQSLRDVFSAKEEYLNASIKSMEEKSGSILNYLTDVLYVNIDALRNKFLE